jgi:hypothetical protein
MLPFTCSICRPSITITLSAHGSSTSELKRTFVKEEEFMCSGAVLEGNNESGARAVDSHGSSNLVATGDARQLVAGPDTEDGSHGEVGVDDARTVEGVERDTESACEITRW